MFYLRLNLNKVPFGDGRIAEAMFKLMLAGVTDPAVYAADPVCGTYLSSGLTSVATSGTYVGTYANGEFSNAVYKAKPFRSNGSIVNADRVNIAVAPVDKTYVVYTTVNTGETTIAATKKELATIGSTYLKSSCTYNFGYASSVSMVLAPTFMLLSMNYDENSAYQSSFHHTKNGVTTTLHAYSNNATTSPSRHALWLGNSVWPEPANYDEFLTLIINYGPMLTVAQKQHEPGSLMQGYLRMPSIIKAQDGVTNVKPIFSFKTIRCLDNVEIDHTADCQVLICSYSTAQEYSDIVVNNGTTYTAIGRFLVAL